MTDKHSGLAPINLIDLAVREVRCPVCGYNAKPEDETIGDYMLLAGNHLRQEEQVVKADEKRRAAKRRRDAHVGLEPAAFTVEPVYDHWELACPACLAGVEEMDHSLAGLLAAAQAHLDKELGEA